MNKIWKDLAEVLSGHRQVSVEVSSSKYKKPRVANKRSRQKSIRNQPRRVDDEVYSKEETRAHYDRIVDLLLEKDYDEDLIENKSTEKH